MDSADELFAYLDGFNVHVGRHIDGCDGEIQHGKRFPLRPKDDVYKTFVRPTILYRSEIWSERNSLG